MIERKRLRGVLATLQTPFNEDGTVDEPLFRANAERLANCGAHGVYCFGSSAEFFSVSLTEFKRLTEAFVDAVGDGPLKIVGCLSIDLREILEKAEHARACGADAIFTAPPFFNPLSREEKVASMREIARSFPDIGVIDYNEPTVRYGMLTPPEYAELAKEENFWGSKQGDLTVTDWTELGRLTPELAHLAGWDSLMVPTMMLGARGVFSALVCLCPPVALELYGLCIDGDWDGAVRLHHQLERFWHTAYEPLTERGYADPAIDKAMMNAFGFVPGGTTRSPIRPVTREEEREIRRLVKAEFGFLLATGERGTEGT